MREPMHVRTHAQTALVGPSGSLHVLDSPLVDEIPCSVRGKQRSIVTLVWNHIRGSAKQPLLIPELSELQFCESKSTI